MRLSILGGCGGWPTASQPCSGYLLEHHDFRLLIDPGYAVFPRLLEHLSADEVDAVFVSHGHPDHCADLNPLLRARVLQSDAGILPVYAPAHALDRVLELDQVRSVRRGAEVMTMSDGTSVQVGPFELETVALPHHVPNLGLRVTADDDVLVYTGDSGHCADRSALAKDADLLLAEASYARQIPGEDSPYLSTAAQVGEDAAAGDVGLSLLTHLLPGVDAQEALQAANAPATMDVQLALPRMVVDVDSIRRGPAPRRAYGGKLDRLVRSGPSNGNLYQARRGRGK